VTPDKLALQRLLQQRLTGIAALFFRTHRRPSHPHSRLPAQR
jgi:hypothetical protein